MGGHAQTADLGLGSLRPGLGDHGRPWETMGGHAQTMDLGLGGVHPGP